MERILQRKALKNSDCVFICIGNSNITGDSLGPVVGSYLKEHSKLEVYGDLRHNICTQTDIKNIKEKLKNKKVIAIDSAVSNIADIGEIFVTNNKCAMGSGIKQNEEKIGDITIKAVVAKKEEDNLKTICNLLNVKQEFIYDLAKKIGESILA